MAAGVGSKASMPDDGRGDRQQQRGPRNPRRDGVKPEGGGQPHRQRKGGANRDRTHHAERPAAVYDPMAGERPKSSPRANPSAEPKPVGEMQRRPRNRRPSNGGKGYGSQG